MYAGSVSGKQEQSIAGMKLQTVVLSESRVSQDMHFEPWDPDPEPIFYIFSIFSTKCV